MWKCVLAALWPFTLGSRQRPSFLSVHLTSWRSQRLFAQLEPTRRWTQGWSKRGAPTCGQRTHCSHKQPEEEGGGLKLWPLTQKDWHFLFLSESEGRITNNKHELMLCLQLSVWLVSYMTHKTFIWKPLWQEVRHEKSTDIKAFFKIKHYADSCLFNPKTD